jgi:large subunit ribosomal protein L4
MPKITLYRQDGTALPEIDLPDSIFAVEDRPGLLHQVVVAQLSNKRQATKMTKNRSHVRGGGKKPYRQKGTGRARQGSTRASQWVGGGRPFGNQVYNFHHDLPPKMRRGALRCALSRKFRSQEIMVVDEIKLPEIKTKAFASILAKLKLAQGTVVIHDGLSQAEMLSARNIEGLRLVRSQDLSALDAVQARTLLFVRDTIESLERRLAA